MVEFLSTLILLAVPLGAVVSGMLFFMAVCLFMCGFASMLKVPIRLSKKAWRYGSCGDQIQPGTVSIQSTSNLVDKQVVLLPANTEGARTQG